MNSASNSTPASRDLAISVVPAWSLDEPGSSDAAIDGIDHVANPHARCPVALLLDTSGSMQGAPLAALQDALGQFFTEVEADELALLSIEVALFTVGGSVANPVKFGDSIEVSAKSPPTLRAEGQTPLGEAARKAIQAIRERQAVYRQNAIPAYRPWVVILSDGEANDPGWETAADELRTLAEKQKWNVFCVAIGDRANAAHLQRFGMVPVQQLAGLKFSALFQWLSDSLKIVSRSSAGASTRPLPSTSQWSFTP